MNTEKKPTQEELLKAVADVLDEALLTYEQLNKGEAMLDMQAVDDMKSQGKGVVGDGMGAKPAMAKDDEKEDKEKDKDDKDDKKKDMEKTDAELLDTYKSLTTQLEARGLIKKEAKDEKKEEMKKSETAVVETPVAPVDHSVELRKSVDERFDSLTKAIKEVAETVKKIATAPAARKGLAGYAPLKKSEDAAVVAAAPLKKSDVLGKLLDLRKSGDHRVDSLLINRVETGRLAKGDEERIKSLGILGE